MKHDYRNKFNMELLNGKIVMAFTDPLDTLMENYNDSVENDNYKYFTDNFTGEGVHTYYIFDTKEEFLDKWKEIHDKPNGMWYWCIDNGVCFCSGACDPDDIEIFWKNIDDESGYRRVNNDTWICNQIEDKLKQWKEKIKKSKFINHWEDQEFEDAYVMGMEEIISDIEKIFYQ